MYLRLIVCIIALVSAVEVGAQTNVRSASSLLAAGNFVAAQDASVVLRAMSDELQRSIKGLKFREADKPYFIEYAIEDADDATLTATFGAITRRERTRTRILRTRVRIGSYDFDNTGYLNPTDFFTIASSSRALPVEDDYNALRHEIWLSTDAAYKAAVEQLARKKAFVANKQDDAPTADFTREAATVKVDEAAWQMDFDASVWERRVREMSNVFRDFAEIQDSNVTLRVRGKCEYLVNSEGTRIREPYKIVALETRAATQTSDGARLANLTPRRARAIEDLPSHEQAMRDVRLMANELTSLKQAAPLTENYSGPVLFEGLAASEMWAQTLAPELADERPPLAESTELTDALGFRRSAFADRRNRPVLPREFNVTDDPTLAKLTDVDNQNLIGGYAVDEQGVAPQRVRLIENGLLKDFLKSRRPRERSSNATASENALEQSNGHGRGGSYTEPRAFIGNLLIETTSGGLSAEDLKRRLLAACQAENLEYGFIVRKLLTPGSQTLPSEDDATSNQINRLAPLGVYRVDVKTGAETLLRSVSLGEISARSLRRLVAWSSERFVLNRIGTTETYPSGDIAAGIATSIVAPSVIIDEMEIRRITGVRAVPTVLTNPYFKK